MKKYNLVIIVIGMLFISGKARATGIQTPALDSENTSGEVQRLRHLDNVADIQRNYAPVRYDSAGLDSFICTTMVSYHIPGVATWARKNGQVIWQRCYGYANIEDSIPVADTTLFMLASESKPFTATAIMQLWEREDFGLDDNINDYLPFNVRNPNYPDSIITFRMLMTHTSSIDDNWTVLDSLYVWGGDSPLALCYFLEEYLVPGGVYYDSAANFHTWPPGSEHDYCNVAAALLGCLVEEMADSFPIYSRDSIFSPLSMNETSWFLAGLDTNNIAVPYHWNFNYVPYQHYGYPEYPSGQLRTSVLQLAQHLTAFIQYGMIDSVRILDSTTVDLMRTIQYQVNPNLMMGLIWMYVYISPRWLWGHGGADYGVSTVTAFCPAESSAAIVLTNGESYDGKVAIMNALFDYAEQYAIEEQQVTKSIIPRNNLITTIFSGPLLLPKGESCRVFDITGRVVAPDKIRTGIYFIEIDGRITQKVVKIR